MSRKLTNKQLLVLEVIRRHAAGIDAKAVAAEVTEGLSPGPCPRCRASGEDPYRTGRPCWRCDGSGEAPPWFDYGMAYAALQRLHAVGLAERRAKLDEFGDATGGIVYAPAAADPDHDDPLEQAFALPAAPEPRP